MVRTYWLVPVFNEASGVLGLTTIRTKTKSKPVAPVLCTQQMVLGRPAQRRFLPFFFFFFPQRLRFCLPCLRFFFLRHFDFAGP